MNKHELIGLIIVWGVILSVIGYFIYRKEYTDHTYLIHKNVSAVIIDNGLYLHESGDKHRAVNNVKFFLIRLTTDTTQYTELNSMNWLSILYGKSRYINWSEFYYNHKVGDTLHFDYIRKDRFFTVTR